MGGRNKALRNPRTCGALEDLAQEHLVEKQTSEDLKDSYAYLRKVEHRLQMKDDAQTHSMPTEPEAIENIARFCGYAETADFEHDLLFHLRRVNDHYNDLFAQEDPLSGAEGSLVFTGVDDDPDTLDTLSSLGFQRPKDVAARVRSWHFGRIRATRSERARERLTKLMPALLQAVSKTPDPDTTFARFHDFLSGLPAGVQLFSLFYSQADLLYLLTDALGTAPRLGPYLAQNASVIDALLDADFLVSLPTLQDLREELQAQLSQTQDFEDTLNRARRWGKDHEFRIGIQVLRGIASSDVAGEAYANLADVFIEGLSGAARQEIERVHGQVPGSEFVVIAMGKLGGRELTATSDLDLIMVCDYPEDVTESVGGRPIDCTRYFTRLAQRVIAALSAQTAEGSLYEVDMKLRPAGNAGPICTKFSYFERYYQEDAWTWEKMALTRARILTGSEDLSKRVETLVSRVIGAQRDTGQLATDVVDMRLRLIQEKGTENLWALKQVRGGLIDLEFICQFLQLAHGAEHPNIFDQNTSAAFARLADAGVMEQDLSQNLQSAARILHNLTQVIRIAVIGEFKPEEAGEALRALLAKSVDLTTFEDVEAILRETQDFVLATFEELVAANAIDVNAN